MRRPLLFVKARWNRRQMARWCQRAGVRLVRWREAKLLEGPSSWKRGERHVRIQVVDAMGQPCGGFLTFRRWWTSLRGAEVIWDGGVRPTPDVHGLAGGRRSLLRWLRHSSLTSSPEPVRVPRPPGS